MLNTLILKNKEIHFLGHIIGENSIRPIINKVHLVTKFGSLSTAELRNFLGMITYLKKFIPDLLTTNNACSATNSKGCNSPRNSDKSRSYF